MRNNIFIGYDGRYPLAYAVAARSLLMTNNTDLHAGHIHPILLPHLCGTGLYDRPTTIKDGVMHDEISGFPMSTEFAISRFLVPTLARLSEQDAQWSLFCDSDFMFRENVDDLFDLADDDFAVMCVKHDYAPKESEKMNGQVQTNYPRKNWSSLILFNNNHPSNRALDTDAVNEKRGKLLHGFDWLDDDEIGELPVEWNWLEGHSPESVKPKAVHFTRGTPDMPGYETVPYADEWLGIAKTISMPKVL